MNNTNEVLAPVSEKDHLENLSNIAHAYHETINGKKDQVQIDSALYVKADVSITVASGPQGGQSQGWITYEDGKKLYFSADETKGEGDFAMGGGLPRQVFKVLPYEFLNNSNGEYDTKGGLISGTYSITCNGQPVFIFALPVFGGGPWSWWAKGSGKFKAG